MRYLLGGMLLLLSSSFIGCSESRDSAPIDVPENNPYQQTPEEIEKYNAAGAEKMKDPAAGN
jgi:hypothetical protein